MSFLRKDAGRAAFLFAAVAGASTTLTAASAGAQERPYMKVGPWQILKIDDAGKFSRCTASMTTKAGMVRIHQMASGAWVVSIPRGDVPRGTTVAGELEFGRQSAPITVLADKFERASFPLDRGMTDAFKGLERLQVKVLSKTYVWQLTNTGAAMGAIEECRFKALRS